MQVMEYSYDSRLMLKLGCFFPTYRSPVAFSQYQTHRSEYVPILERCRAFPCDKLQVLECFRGRQRCGEDKGYQG
jgi:hypothetical protein